MRFCVVKVGAIVVRQDFRKVLMLLTLTNVAIWICGVGCVKAVVRKKGVQSGASPLIALMDKCSVEQFEQTVRQHPEWVNQKSALLPEENNPSPLSAAAITDRTNIIAVLMDNGADPRESMHWLQKNGFADRVQLLIRTRR